MTLSDACSILVQQTCLLSEVRRERDAYRLLAVQSLHALHVANVRDRERERRYLHVLEKVRELSQTTTRAA